MRMTRPLLSWSLYDWASSPVPTLHTTFIFSVFFTTAVMPDGGTAAWAWMTSASALLIAVAAPVLGRLADGRGAVKGFLLYATIIGAAATADKWRWAEIQPDGNPQSEQRPQPRFHHTLSVVRNQLVIVGGHDHTLAPILSPYALSVAALSVEADASGLPRIIGAAEARWRPLADAPRDTVYEAGPKARARACVHRGQGITNGGT